MIIDTHVHAGPSWGFITGDWPVEQLIGQFDEAGVQTGVISICNGKNPAAGNDLARQACADYPERLVAYVYLNPRDPEGAIEELERCASIDCFRGVKLHPMNDVYYPFFEGYFSVYERIEAKGLPVLWHSGTSPYSHPLQIAYVASKFPGNTHILGHFGLSDLTWECFPAADLAPNIVIDTSANPIVPVYNDFIRRFGAKRVLWGSDYPFYNVPYELKKLDYFDASADEIEQIRCANARRLFKI